MKSAVNKITEGAKLRDTIGRNQCPVLDISEMSARELVTTILKWQITVSSDNVEKVTNVILIDSEGANLLLKFRAMLLAGLNEDRLEDLNSKLIIEKSETKDTLVKVTNRKGDDSNDK